MIGDLYSCSSTHNYNYWAASEKYCMEQEPVLSTTWKKSIKLTIKLTESGETDNGIVSHCKKTPKLSLKERLFHFRSKIRSTLYIDS